MKNETKTQNAKSFKTVKFEVTKQQQKYDKENKNPLPCESLKEIYYLVLDWYGKDELDFGEYWEYDSGTIFPRSEDGALVSEDKQDIVDFIAETEFSYDTLNEMVNHLVNPHDFIEIKTGNKKNITIRATAIQDRPILDSTRFDVDLSPNALHRVKVYGVPMQKDMILARRNMIWRADINEWILSLIKSNVTVDCELHLAGKGIVMSDDGGTTISLDVVAKSRDDLIEIMKCLGAKTVFEDRVVEDRIEGNENSDDRRVYSRISIVSRV